VGVRVGLRVFPYACVTHSHSFPRQRRRYSIIQQIKGNRDIAVLRFNACEQGSGRHQTSVDITASRGAWCRNRGQNRAPEWSLPPVVCPMEVFKQFQRSCPPNITKGFAYISTVTVVSAANANRSVWLQWSLHLLFALVDSRLRQVDKI